MPLSEHLFLFTWLIPDCHCPFKQLWNSNYCFFSTTLWLKADYTCPFKQMLNTDLCYYMVPLNDCLLSLSLHYCWTLIALFPCPTLYDCWLSLATSRNFKELWISLNLFWNLIILITLYYCWMMIILVVSLSHFFMIENWFHLSHPCLFFFFPNLILLNLSLFISFILKFMLIWILLIFIKFIFPNNTDNPWMFAPSLYSLRRANIIV